MPAKTGVMVCMCLLFCSPLLLQGQDRQIDSLIQLLPSKKDTARVNTLYQISRLYFNSAVSVTDPEYQSKIEKAEAYGVLTESEARKIHYDIGIGNGLMLQGIAKYNYKKTKTAKGLELFWEAIPYLNKAGAKNRLGACYFNIGLGYHQLGEFDKAILSFDSSASNYMSVGDTGQHIRSKIMFAHCYFDKGNYQAAYEKFSAILKEAEKTGDALTVTHCLSNFVSLFNEAGLTDLAIEYLNRIKSLYDVDHVKPGEMDPYVLSGLRHGAEAFLKQGQLDSCIVITKYIPEDSTDEDAMIYYGKYYKALKKEDKSVTCFQKALLLAQDQEHAIGVARASNELALIYLGTGDIAKSTYYANVSFRTANEVHATLEKKNAAAILSDLYEKQKDYNKAFYYAKLFKNLSDTLAPEDYKRQLALLDIKSELDNQKQKALLLTKENEVKEQRLQREGLMKKSFAGGVVSLLLITGLVIRNNRHKQKNNLLLQKKNEEIEQAFDQLKKTQNQLVHAEKMASLGELTAGIAHEIQNPLNFVNNFSELNNELLQELQEGPVQKLEGDSRKEAEGIIHDLKSNMDKINMHGKRADDIVKSMLQHSRAAGNKKELTDINALVNEFINLAFHGMRAKFKDFQATVETDLDPGIEKLNIIPQDIGRVLLNLFNNAFYAVSEKMKSAGSDYKPTVSVATKRIDNTRVLVIVTDNGIGIPAGILEKIFQPFFTTKPTGQGTGLGLSMSYDIITKGHDGKLTVESEEGKGSRFVIELPI